MQPSELLREAAQVMDWREHRSGCCAAVMTADKTNEPSEETLISALEYLNLFKPDRKSTWWFGNLTQANENIRILALLFAAAIAESEGR